MVQKVFMIIDDDKDDRFFFKEALKKMLHSPICLEADGGVEALQLLRKVEQLPDFIFLDINMVCMDGRECLTELKKDAKLKNVPVIMYSTSSTEESIAEFLKLGAAGYLNKPMDMKMLPEQILAAIRKRTKLL